MERVYQWMATAPLLHKAGIVVALMGGIASYYYFFPLAEATKIIEESKNKIEYSRNSLDSQRRKLQQTKKAKDELKDIDKKSAELDKRIPGSVDMSELVGELDLMADDIRINQIIPMENDSSSYDSVVIKPIVFKLQGRYHSLCRFMYKMFQMGRLMDIGDISLISKTTQKTGINSGNKSNNNILAAEFTTRIYFSPHSASIVIPKKGSSAKTAGRHK
jgi:Tfp pilus assembly protein PilO